MVAGMKPEWLGGTMERVYQKYPILKKHGIEARRGRPEQGRGRRLEFYPPEESRNPMPGIPLIEVYDPQLKGPALERALFGDALHYLKDVDPEFQKYRNLFRESLTPEQRAGSRRRYNYYRKHGDPPESRPYDKWFEISDLDQFLGGYLAPADRNEWEGIYSAKQKYILEAMKSYLESAE